MREGSMIISSVVVAFLIPFIFGMLKKDIKLTNEFKTHFVIDVKWLMKLSLVFMIITFTLTILLNICVELPIFANIILIVCNLSYIILIVACRFKIVVNDNEILYTPSFAKRKKYAFSDISVIRIKELNNGIVNYKLYIGDKKIFSLSNMLKNVQEFINMARANNVRFEQQ